MLTISKGWVIVSSENATGTLEVTFFAEIKDLNQFYMFLILFLTYFKMFFIVRPFFFFLRVESKFLQLL